jgi:hypothetical protein
MQLVQDLRTLRALAEYLLRFDAVTFLMYLENLRATEGVTSVWLFHDAAHTIFEQVCMLGLHAEGSRVHVFCVPMCGFVTHAMQCKQSCLSVV